MEILFPLVEFSAKGKYVSFFFYYFCTVKINTMIQKRKHYETPQLTVAEFKTERGYAESVLFTGSVFMMFNSSLGDHFEGTSQLEGQVFQNFGWSDEFSN